MLFMKPGAKVNSCAISLEPLEGRLMLSAATATSSGRLAEATMYLGLDAQSKYSVESRPIVEAGEELPPTASVKGVVFGDNNGNGILDAGEPVVPNATVIVTESGVKRYRTTAGPDGNYEITID